MADKKVCDICGRDINYSGFWRNFWGYTLVSNPTGRKCDICDDCMDDLRKLLKNKRKEEHNEHDNGTD